MLFKGKTMSDGKVIRGHFFEDGKNSFIICNDSTAMPKHGDRSGSIRYYMVHPESVGAYTGLMDRNEKMVFGADWIELMDKNIHMVVFKQGSFGIELPDGTFKLLSELRRPLHTVITESGESIVVEYECLFTRVNERNVPPEAKERREENLVEALKRESRRKAIEKLLSPICKEQTPEARLADESIS